MATNCAPRHRRARRINFPKRRSASCSGFSSRDRCPVVAKRDDRRAPCSASGGNASVRSRTKSWFATSSKKPLSCGLRRSPRRAPTWSVSGGSATRRRSGSPLRVRSAMPCCRSRRRSPMVISLLAEPWVADLWRAALGPRAADPISRALAWRSAGRLLRAADELREVEQPGGRLAPRPMFARGRRTEVGRRDPRRAEGRGPLAARAPRAPDTDGGVGGGRGRLPGARGRAAAQPSPSLLTPSRGARSAGHDSAAVSARTDRRIDWPRSVAGWRARLATRRVSRRLGPGRCAMARRACLATWPAWPGSRSVAPGSPTAACAMPNEPSVTRCAVCAAATARDATWTPSAGGSRSRSDADGCSRRMTISNCSNGWQSAPLPRRRPRPSSPPASNWRGVARTPRSNAARPTSPRSRGAAPGAREDALEAGVACAGGSLPRLARSRRGGRTTPGERGHRRSDWRWSRRSASRSSLTPVVETPPTPRPRTRSSVRSGRRS